MCSFYEKKNSFFFFSSCFWEVNGVAGKSGRIFLFLFQSWEAKSDCDIKGLPTKRSYIFGASVTALRPYETCLNTIVHFWKD